MAFKYKWATSKDGNYAIRRKDAKGKPAGKEIEAKNKSQTSTSHFFLLADTDDENTYNRIKTNNILKTITYEYVIKGTDKKSKVKYLTKNDIDNILSNIEQYKNKTITIENTPKFYSVRESDEAKIIEQNEAVIEGLKKKVSKLFIEKYGENSKIWNDVMKLLIQNIEKENDLKMEKKKAENDIKIIHRQANEQIEKIKTKLVEKEKTFAIEKEIIEKNIFDTRPKELKKLKYRSDDPMSSFQLLLPSLYDEALKEKKRKATNKIQAEYRKRVSAKSGKPKRKVGRPKKK